MRIRSFPLRSQFNVRFGTTYTQRRLSQTTVEDVANLLPPVPPPSCGAVRERLGIWQVDYDRFLDGVSVKRVQENNVLSKLFPISPKGARNVSDEEDEESRSPIDQIEYDVLAYESLGEIGKWMNLNYLVPGFLTELK
jgi:hypothetical protein